MVTDESLIEKFLAEKGATYIPPSSRKIATPKGTGLRRGRPRDTYCPPAGLEALYRKSKRILGAEEAQRQIEALARKEARG